MVILFLKICKPMYEFPISPVTQISSLLFDPDLKINFPFFTNPNTVIVIDKVLLLTISPPKR